MTNIEAIKFAAKVQIGSEIEGYGGQVMVVTEIKESYFKGYSKYVFEKYGRKESTMSLSFETLLNPHYCESLKIVNS